MVRGVNRECGRGFAIGRTVKNPDNALFRIHNIDDQGEVSLTPTNNDGQALRRQGLGFRVEGLGTCLRSTLGTGAFAKSAVCVSCVLPFSSRRSMSSATSSSHPCFMCLWAVGVLCKVGVEPFLHVCCLYLQSAVDVLCNIVAAPIAKRTRRSLCPTPSSC